MPTKFPTGAGVVNKARSEWHQPIPPGTPLTLIYSDDFESYTTGAKANGSNAEFSFDSERDVSESESVSGTKSLEFGFLGAPSPANGDSPQHFSLTSLETELTIKYKLHIPANYEHRLGGGENNKFFRLYVNGAYTAVEKVGFSTIRQGTADEDSAMRLEYSDLDAIVSEMTRKDQKDDFITTVDYDTWMDIKIVAKAPTATEPGYLALYKNDVLFVSSVMPSRGYTEDGWNRAYLMGYANSGFTNTTYFHIDDFEIYRGIEI